MRAMWPPLPASIRNVQADVSEPGEDEVQSSRETVGQTLFLVLPALALISLRIPLRIFALAQKMPPPESRARELL